MSQKDADFPSADYSVPTVCGGQNRPAQGNLESILESPLKRHGGYLYLICILGARVDQEELNFYGLPGPLKDSAKAVL